MNTHEGYSKKKLSNDNVLLAGGGEKSLADFLGGIRISSSKIQYKAADSAAAWTDLITLVNTDENVKQVDNNADANIPLVLKNGTGTGTITSSVRTVDGVTVNPSTNSLNVSGNGNFGGAIKRYYGSASNDPMIALTSNNLDVWLWRINHGTSASTSTSAASGFGLKYLGTGSDNNNKLVLYSDNQTGTLIAAMTMYLDGVIALNNSLILIGNTSEKMGYSDNIHPRICFRNSDATQNVDFIFTDYNSYRATAGVKLVGNLGEEWFEAPNIYQNGTKVSVEGHDHDDKYVTLVGVTDDTTNHPNQLRYVKNNVSTYFTVPYATKAALDSNGRSLVTYKEYSDTFPPNDGTEKWYTILNYANNYYSQSAILEINTRKASAVILITFYNTNTPYITCLSYYGSPSTSAGGFTGKIRVIASDNNAIIQGAFYATTLTTSSYKYLGLKIYCENPAKWSLPDTITADTATYDSLLANVEFKVEGFTAGHISTYKDNTYNIGSTTYKYKNVYATTFHGALDGNASTASKWETARTLTLTGSVTGSASIDGSGNVSLATTTNHTHTFAAITNKITNTNEFNFVDNLYATIWFNYRNASNSASTTLTTDFYFGKGNASSAAYAYVNAEGFKKRGSSSAYVLLGDGSHKALSDFSMSHSHPYLFSEQVSETQTNVTWATNYAKTNRRAFTYNTNGTEWSYLFGLSSSNTAVNGENCATYGAILKMSYADRYLRMIRVYGGKWYKTDGSQNSTVGDTTGVDWEKIYAGYADSAGYTKNLYDYYGGSGRPSSANLALGDGSVRFFEATSSMTTGKPDIGDSSILHLSWDNTNGWDKLIAVGHGSDPHMMIRSQNSGTWSSWKYILDSSNYTSYCAAASHNHDGRYVQDYGSSITVALYDIPTKYVFSGNNVVDGPTTGWISGLVLGSNWNNNHYLHYLVENGSRWYATRSYANSKMKDWNTFAYLSDIKWSLLADKPSTFTPSSHTHPFSQITDGTCTSTASGWSHILNNSYGGSVKAQLYMCHGSAYGMHLRGYTTSSSIYLLLIYNNSSEMFGVYGDGHVNFGGNLVISHATNATMTAASTNPKITFSESGTLPVHLIYTDYDSYRSPAGLKVVGGTDATPAWFEVEGDVWARHYYESSDIRLKHDISMISKSIRKFRFNNDDRLCYGFIAQELEKSNPELVDTSGEHWTVNYNSAICYYIAELENKVQKLEDEIQKLKNN